MTVKYRCLAPTCGAAFQSEKPLGPGAACTACGSLYLRWANYSEWHRAPGKTARYQKMYP